MRHHKKKMTVETFHSHDSLIAIDFYSIQTHIKFKPTKFQKQEHNFSPFFEEINQTQGEHCQPTKSNTPKTRLNICIRRSPS